jgi:hypothetical protein
MPDQDHLAARLFWHRRAKFLAWKLNLHHWLARLIPNLLVVLVLETIFELLRREAGSPGRWSEALLLCGFTLASGVAWLQARDHFCSANQALVRLETVLRLHNRLSAAEAGVVPWPAPPAKIHDGYAANWPMLALPLLAGSLLLTAAHFVPVSSLKLGASAEPLSEPPDLTQVQSWINALKAEDLIEPEKLQEMQSALDKLREQPSQDWYKQSDLEAANSLKELMEQSMNTLSHDLDEADRAVEAMRQKAESGNGADGLQPLQDELRKAGENLASGTLPLNKEMTGELSGAEMAQDKTLSAAQLQALHARLKRGELAAQTAPKSGGGLSDEMQQAMTAAAMGQGAGHRMTMPGSGGLGGGTETAPLDLQSRDKTTGQGAMHPVSNEDLSRASLGETLKVTASEHNVNPADYHGPQTAGQAQVNGLSGEAVWRSTYDPQEADTLERFFK